MDWGGLRHRGEPDVAAVANVLLRWREPADVGVGAEHRVGGIRVRWRGTAGDETGVSFRNGPVRDDDERGEPYGLLVRCRGEACDGVWAAGGYGDAVLDG